MRFPRGMDANDYALKVTPAAQSLGVLLRSAQYMTGPLQNSHRDPDPDGVNDFLAHHRGKGLFFL